jgi:hypothetical protein
VTLEYFASIPFLNEFIRQIAYKDLNLYIILPDKPIPSFQSPNQSINFYSYKKTTGVFGYLYKVVTIIKLGIKIYRQKGYSCIVGFSQLGIILSWVLKILFPKIALVYLNDELWYNDYEKKLSYYPLKMLEKISTKYSDLVVTQDEIRGKFLSILNGISYKKILYLPNSRIGRAKLCNSTYLHSRIGVSTEKKIILWIGAVIEGSGARNIAKQAERWPEDFILVFHSRSGIKSLYNSKILEYNRKNNIFINEFELTYDTLPDIYSSTYIGIAYYFDKGINSRLICYSSGKINSFLQYGVPVITSSLIGLKWVEKTGAGICVNNIIEASSAIKKIKKNYEEYTKKACTTFDSNLKIDNYMSEILKRIHLLIN